MNNVKQILKNELLSKQDIKYQKFQTGLCPGINNIIGIQTPKIKEIAKRLIKEYELKDIYNEIDTEYYEEIMIKGLLIAYSKEEFHEIKKYIQDFIPLINNWAICDTFCSSLKITKKYKKEMRDLILNYKDTNKEYELRFMIVMILNYYTEEVYLKENFKIFDEIKNNQYYVEMAISWALSISLIKYYNETINYLKNSKISTFTYNKTISKACDSYRINKEIKQELRKMRKK